MRIFMTGAAGFIGFHLARRLLNDGHEVDGYDGLTSYYDIDLKRARLGMLRRMEGFTYACAMLEDRSALQGAIERFEPTVIIHLAAQAGVRYSLEHPEAYINSNVLGTFNLLEVARTIKPEHLLLASTSSVYGGNTTFPFSESDRTDFPMSLYAATKRSCEAMSHSYSHLFEVPTTCFRFFTVYGPWGRPDMAPFKFVDAIFNGRQIDVYGFGRMKRDFTFVDDLVESVARLLVCQPKAGHGIIEGDSVSPVAPFRTVNIAGGTPVELMEFIEAIEGAIGRSAIRNYIGMQSGDVTETQANSTLLQALTGYAPRTDLREGISSYVKWYREYYGGLSEPPAENGDSLGKPDELPNVVTAVAQ